SLAAVHTHTHTHTVNFKGGEKELLKKGRGAEIFSGSNFGAQNFNNCGQNLDRGSCNSKGITLIALIITIVIMLILAGITINLTLGENGIFQKAKLAKGQYETASVQERLELELAAMQMEGQTGLTVETYVDQLREKGVVLQENIFQRKAEANEYETALKIEDLIYVVYSKLGTNQIKIYCEGRENIMKLDWLDGTDIDRVYIKSIIFENKIPDLTNVLNKKDITANGQKPGSVMCWWTGNDAEGYNIIIGANGDVIAPRNCAYLFAGMHNLETISSNVDNPVSFDDNFNTKVTTNMHRMFEGCSALQNINLGDKFNTKNVINMEWLFRGCSSLSSVALGNNFYTERIRNLAVMFQSCTNLKKVDLGDRFSTKEVTSCVDMFAYISNLEELNLGNFGVERQPNLNTGGIFYGTTISNCKLIIKNSAKDWFYANCKPRENWGSVEEID
ncbi:MAG: BspA family leucine-rich repeat surface protein, partial [Clostridia bacterium]|nr:BspA family leucine-rich repeat surface protein [Clostridia bacterium]